MRILMMCAAMALVAGCTAVARAPKAEVSVNGTIYEVQRVGSEIRVRPETLLFTGKSGPELKAGAIQAAEQHTGCKVDLASVAGSADHMLALIVCP